MHDTYERLHSDFDMTFEFYEVSKNIEVHDAVPNFNNSSASGDSEYGITKEYYYFDDNDNRHKVMTTTPFILHGHKLLVRFIITGDETPTIHSCTVKYKLK